MRIPLFVFLYFLSGCSPANTDKQIASADLSTGKTKDDLLSLERKWLEAEFALDTAYVSSLLDSTFISISSDHISNKQQELEGIYENISAMRKDSIFLDSMKFEEALVHVYGNTAVASFIVHTYKKNKGKPTEKRTRFYDVWIKRGENWQAVSSQGTTVE
ncbi:MAG TPA: nuclear transport factor 2 family protein [Ferruginibacter sp.]|nr:nuclear transport factor 2 family protein [Ferruginibacter sp.]